MIRLPNVSGLLALDAGPTGIRLRWEHGQERLEGGASGLLTDRPLMPQLASAIGTFLTEHRLSPTSVGVGSTGLATPEATELLGLVARHGITEVAVAHNATTSYLGALGDAPGAVIAAETGAVTLAVGASRVARVDGWGRLLGDAGSAFWIGRAGMEAALRAYDGRGRMTPLTERLREVFPDLSAARLDLEPDDRWVSRIASFATVVDGVADDDPVAAGILEEAAAELSESVLAGLRRVGLMGSEPPRVCALGQVLRLRHIRARFTSYLRLQWPGLELAEPLGNALHGAALLANLGETSPLSSLVARAEL